MTAQATSTPPSLATSCADYWALTKPRVVALIVFTAVAGMAFAAARTNATPDALALLAATLGIGLAAAGAAAANCLLERHLDARMARTQNRATAAGRVAPVSATIFAMTLLLAGLACLQAATNTLTTLLTLGTFIGYAFVYTILLKPSTPQNIVIGGAAGAMPPVLGWTAVTGAIDYQPLLLFLIIFVWTPPHFWALALYRIDDYRRAAIPMLPVTHGPALTRLHVLLYSLALAAISLLPTATGMAGWLYGTGAVAADAVFVWLAWRLWRDGTDAAARRLFNFSGFYLLAVFAALLVDALLPRLT